MKKASFLCGVGVLLASAALPAAAQTPDFSGRWQIDREKSDPAVQAIRAGAGQLRKGRDQMLQRYLADVLLQLASDASTLEIEQTSKDIKIFDRAGNVNIYYIDGKKHVREEPALGTMETTTQWRGNELVVESKGKQSGRGVQTFAMEGDQLVLKVRVDPKTFDNEVAADFYYDRVE